MNCETLTRLLAADDPVNWEQPDGWLQEYPGAMKRVRAAAADLNRALGRRFYSEPYGSIQDAAYYATLDTAEPDGHGDKTSGIEIRFSAFGNLFTTTTWGRSLLSESDHACLISVVESHGFAYIAASDAREPYTGSHPGFRESTWWHRFFDYN